NVTDKTRFIQAIMDHAEAVQDWMSAAFQERAEALQTRFDQQTAELQELRGAHLESNGALKNLRIAFQKLEGQRNNLRDRNTALEANAAIGLGPTHHQKDSKRHPDPDKFDGTQIKLMEFLGQLQLKLAANRDWFPIEHDKVIYACGRLS
ncbi:MAG: hypothetical protein L6R37_008479, partial [Teloschistes peruensis]